MSRHIIRFSLLIVVLEWRMSEITRDGTAEPVPRNQSLGRERGHGKAHFPCLADLEQNGNHTRLIHTLLKVLIYTGNEVTFNIRGCKFLETGKRRETISGYFNLYTSWYGSLKNHHQHAIGLS